MSRSRRNTPIIPNCGSGSAKSWKSAENRRFRSHIRDLLARGMYDNLPDYSGKWGNEWSSPRDGKHWIGDLRFRPCPFVRKSRFLRGFIISCEDDNHYCYKYYKELMRK